MLIFSKINHLYVIYYSQSYHISSPPSLYPHYLFFHLYRITSLSRVSLPSLARPFHSSSVTVWPSFKLTAIRCHFFGPNLGHSITSSEALYLMILSYLNRPVKSLLPGILQI